MRWIRFRVGALMVAIGVAAINAAVSRELYTYDRWLPFGVLPTGIACQIGLVGLLRCQGLGKAFWAGFVVGGSIAMASYSWAIVWARALGVGPNQTTGQIYSKRPR